MSVPTQYWTSGLTEIAKDSFAQSIRVDRYQPEARAILGELLEKYAEHGTAQLVLPDVLQVPPIKRHGNVIEISSLFGGPDQLRRAVEELQTRLYAA